MCSSDLFYSFKIFTFGPPTGSRCRSVCVFQEKRRKPNVAGGDFIELSSSLITLLNLAQEISTSNNVRFRQAAEKLKNRFARSFSVRYDLDKSNFLTAILATIDGEDKLDNEQIALRDTILLQLRGIERRASSIVFFNEPLSNLDEFKYPHVFPYDALTPFRLDSNDGNLKSTKVIIVK